MLRCRTHYREIDVDGPEDHPEALPLEMKREHELRIELVTGVDQDRASHVVRFGAKIGQHEALVSTRDLFLAMLPQNHPSGGRTIDPEIVGCAYRDDEADYYRYQRDNLRRQFEAQVLGRVERQEIRRVSVFALAPQPLLIELGGLIDDILPAQVMQRNRELATWTWQEDAPPVIYQIGEGDPARTGPIALKIGVSATLTDEPVKAVLGADAAILSLIVSEPHNDILRSPADQARFRSTIRRLLNRIKAVRGEGREIHLFPAMPGSLAAELGRVWIRKADLLWSSTTAKGRASFRLSRLDKTRLPNGWRADVQPPSSNVQFLEMPQVPFMAQAEPVGILRARNGRRPSGWT